MNVFEKVKECISMQLPVKPEQITPDARLVEDLGADSANLMFMIVELEDAFEITVDDSALKGIKTVGDIVAAIEAAV